MTHPDFISPSRYLKRAVLGAILLSGVPTALAQNSSISHEAWGDLLQTYVHQSDDGVNRVDYGALKDNAADSAKLDNYIDQFADLSFDDMTRDEQFAAWANLYNAVTVQYIIGEYPLDSIKPWYSTGPWKKIKVEADGRELSLDAIEHDVLRVKWADDPRLHYSINCASYGCPNLRRDAWVAETLNEDLDGAARDYVNHPRGVTVRERGGLEVSSIYDWFQKDFGGSEASVIDHLLKYADEDLAADIRANNDIRGYEYDWSLNGTGK